MDDNLVARAVRETRQVRGHSLRELARRAGVSAAALSRIEAGVVKQPSMETLGALARALDRNPRYLWIVSGHIEGEDARSLLERALRAEPEPGDGGTEDRKGELSKARALLQNTSATPKQLRSLALEVFTSWRSEEELWWDAYLEPLVRPLSQDLRDLVQDYELLSFGRKQKVREYVREQLELTTIETRRAMGEDV